MWLVYLILKYPLQFIVGWLQKCPNSPFFLSNVALQLSSLYGSESVPLPPWISAGFVTSSVQTEWNGSDRVPVSNPGFKSFCVPPCFLGTLPLPWAQAQASLLEDEIQLEAESIYSVESPISTCPHPTPGDHKWWLSPDKITWA